DARSRVRKHRRRHGCPRPGVATDVRPGRERRCSMTSFTKIILRWLLRDPDTKARARWGLEREADPGHRASDFACILRSEFEERFCYVEGDNRELYNDVFALASAYANWRRIADEILERFGKKLAVAYLATPSVN